MEKTYIRRSNKLLKCLRDIDIDLKKIWLNHQNLYIWNA